MFSESRPELLRWRELRVRRPRPHQRQPVLAAGTGATADDDRTDHRGQGRRSASTCPTASSIDVVRLTSARSAWRPVRRPRRRANRVLARTEGSVVGAAGQRGQPQLADDLARRRPGELQRVPAQRPDRHVTWTGAKRLTPAAHRARRRRHQRRHRAPARRPAKIRLGILYNERLFTKASIRILLSDTAADITNIPGVTATAPIQLTGDWRARTAVRWLHRRGADRAVAGHVHPGRDIRSGPPPEPRRFRSAAIPAMFLNPTLSCKDRCRRASRGPITCNGSDR